MKNNQLFALGAVVVILIAYLFTSSNKDVAVNQLGDTMITLSEIDDSKVAKLVVRQGTKDVLSLTKKANQWQFESEHAANPTKVEGLLENLKSLQAEKRRVNMDQLGTYGLGKEDVRTTLTASDASGKALATVSLGKKGPDWGSAWSQRDGKSEVLLIQEGAVGRLVDGEIKAKDWLNRQPAQFDTKTAAGLTIGGEAKGSFTRPAGLPDAGPLTWTSQAGADVDDAKVEALLNTLSGLYIENIAGDGNATPVLELRVGFAAGERTVILGQTAEKSWQILVGNLAYSLSESTAKSLRNKAREAVGMDKLD